MRIVIVSIILIFTSSNACFSSDAENQAESFANIDEC